MLVRPIASPASVASRWAVRLRTKRPNLTSSTDRAEAPVRFVGARPGEARLLLARHHGVEQPPPDPDLDDQEAASSSPAMPSARR
jgi:hypothetical protein